MPPDFRNVITWPGDPTGPNTPAWEAADDAIKAIVHCFKLIEPHVEKSELEFMLAVCGSSLVTEALKQHKKLAA